MTPSYEGRLSFRTVVLYLKFILSFVVESVVYIAFKYAEVASWWWSVTAYRRDRQFFVSFVSFCYRIETLRTIRITCMVTTMVSNTLRFFVCVGSERSSPPQSFFFLHGSFCFVVLDQQALVKLVNVKGIYPISTWNILHRHIVRSLTNRYLSLMIA